MTLSGIIAKILSDSKDGIVRITKEFQNENGKIKSIDFKPKNDKKSFLNNMNVNMNNNISSVISVKGDITVGENSSMGNINIGNNSSSFKSNDYWQVSVNNEDYVVINGNKLPSLTIVIEGDVQDINTMGKVEIHGSVTGDINTMGKVECGGDVNGKINTSGNIAVSGNVNRNIETMGKVTVEGDVYGKISTMGKIVINENHNNK